MFIIFFEIFERRFLHFISAKFLHLWRIFVNCFKMFLIHLMDISANTSAGTSVSSFADDPRLLRGIREEHYCELLQDDLDHIYSWAVEIGMQFNAGQFELTSSTWSQMGGP